MQSQYKSAILLVQQCKDLYAGENLLKNCHILMGEVHGGGHMYTIHSSSDTHACTACQMIGIKLSAHYQMVKVSWT